MGVSENSGTPKSSILIGFSIKNHPFWGTSIFGNTHMERLVGFTLHQATLARADCARKASVDWRKNVVMVSAMESEIEPKIFNKCSFHHFVYPIVAWPMHIRKPSKQTTKQPNKQTTKQTNKQPTNQTNKVLGKMIPTPTVLSISTSIFSPVNKTRKALNLQKPMFFRQSCVSKGSEDNMVQLIAVLSNKHFRVSNNLPDCC